MVRSGKLFFEDAFLAKERITKETMEEVERLYADWSEEVGRMADFYKHHGTPSSPLSEQYYRQLQASMQVQSGIVAEEAEDLIKASLYKTSREVIEANAGWLSQWGLGTQSSINMAFAGTSNQLVQRLITGQVYKSGWSLSSSIWGDNDKTLKDIYTIMASGQAQSKTVYEIAKDLQQYVNPVKRKDWNPLIRMKNTRTGEFEQKRLYKSKVDYSAQRLVRTLNQHCYQQSVVATTKNNPWVTGIRWIANGSRVCPLCEERDGTIYSKDDVPLDHPNGQCTMEPVIEEDKMIDDLVAWYSGEEGDYPEIDEFAEKLGYEPISKIPNGFEDRAEAYVGGGYSGPEDIFTSKDLEYIYTNMDETRKTLYRVEDSKFTADRLDNDELDIDGFRFNGLRSFTEDKDVIREMLDENSDNWAGIENPVVFEIIGKKDRFDMQEFTKGYTLMDQKESLAGGKYKYKVVGEDIQRIKGIFVRVIKIKQI